MTCRATARAVPVCPAVPKHPYQPRDCMYGWHHGGVIHDCRLREGHDDDHECFCDACADPEDYTGDDDE